MKTTLTFIILLIGFNFLAAQQMESEILFENNPSKSYKPLMKTANILLISGGGLITVGSILIFTDKSANDGWNLFPSGQELAGGFIIILGAVTSIVSIPFYITGYVKKRKLSLSPAITFERQNITQIPITNFGLSINF